MPMHLSLSVEDTNKLRAKLGLRLIPIDQSGGKPVPSSAPASRIQDRLRAITSKLESRQDEKAPEKAPQIKKASAEDSDTITWIEKMRQLKAHSVNKSPTELERSISPPSVPSNFETVQVEVEGTRKLSEVPVIEKPKTNTHRPLKRVYEDPLEAPNETQQAKQDRKADQQHQKTERVVFKPKKLKATAKSRAREPAYMTPPATSLSQEDEDIALEMSLTRSRIAQQTKQMPSSTEKPHIYEKPVSISGISIDTTRDLLGARSSEGDNGTTAIANDRERSEAVFEDHSEGESEAGKGDNQEEVERESDDEQVSTHLGSVADVLQQLRSTERPPDSSVVPKSRDWARRLIQKRREREHELESVASLFQNLPRKEREEAILLHKAKIANEQALDAKEIMKNYTPEITLEHKDDEGHVLTTKGAFKKLSREFHEQRQKNN